MENQEMTTQDETRIVALIERAERETPFCDCGEPVAAIAQNREIWLRCTALKSSTGGTLHRLLTTLASTGHTRKLLIDRV
jgi:hypothetical protein